MADLNKEAMPRHDNVYVYRGDDTDFDVRFRNSAGELMDLSGFTGKASIVKDGNVVGAFECTVSSQGTVTLSLDSETSVSIPTGVYNWDFQLTQNATQKTRTYVKGQVFVLGEVTIGV